MNPQTRIILAPTSAAGIPAIDYLTGRFTYFSSVQWDTEIEQGRLCVNGQPTTPCYLLKEGDSIEFTPAPYIEPEVPRNIPVLFEDENFLFVNKPAGLPSHPSGRFRENTLLSILGKTCSGLHLIHRLDRETSGVLTLAKNPVAAGKAGILLQKHRVIKEYLVFVEGLFPDFLDACGFLVLDTSSVVNKKLRFIQGEQTGTLSCRTEFHCVRQYESGKSLVHARLHTGRTHQIRASLCSLGFPVSGDKIYGRDSGLFIRFIEGSLTSDDYTLLEPGNQALHCYRMVLPVSPEQEYNITCEPPLNWNILAQKPPFHDTLQSILTIEDIDKINVFFEMSYKFGGMQR